MIGPLDEKSPGHDEKLRRRLFLHSPQNSKVTINAKKVIERGIWSVNFVVSESQIIVCFVLKFCNGVHHRSSQSV